MTEVATIVRALNSAYPPELAEPWDKVGLVCGDPAAEVDRVAFALDCTQEVADQAVAAGAQMLVVHHPLLLRGTHTVACDTPKGKILHQLIRSGVALFTAHTNADSARPGVNDKLAELLGVTPGRPIAPRPDPARPRLDHWGVHVPPADRQAVTAALFAAGAGNLGDYAECCFTVTGSGQFCSQPGAQPHEGEVGELYRADEDRVEFVAKRSARAAVLAALKSAHPYEEPAFDVVEMVQAADLNSAPGLGRVGELAEAIRLKDFVQLVADQLPATSWGVRAAGDPDEWIKTVAVSSGAGDSFLDAVRDLGVDCFVTSDLRHHPVDEYRRAGGPAVIDTAHWASEFPWTSQASEIVAAATGVATTIITERTDPWTLSAHPRPSAASTTEN
ncbi:hypothetical protein CATYP_07645 [Corynebacterium atypicum]|uniref:GTP cyclohydrolase 1 type 2 homolog n=1 Tax=Corynebacterium atypicum TaxID=191610 RepID=A0ABN4DDG5_9CORY|nr:Nif3-like dinuclear metal center hexameric protein [Corynebacterium atypicum]AIG64479.1 hypothetical protein CATYP_07645 [Corynebacterium atypicum]